LGEICEFWVEFEGFEGYRKKFPAFSLFLGIQSRHGMREQAFVACLPDIAAATQGS
jgi:hypothetical protein